MEAQNSLTQYMAEDSDSDDADENTAKSPDASPKWEALLGRIAVTGSIQQIMLSHIDRLSPKEQELIKVASVVGMEFSLSVLQTVLPTAFDEHTVVSSCKRLEKCGLLSLSGIEPHLMGTFEHTSMKEVAYQTLSQSSRTSIHYNLARTLEERLENVLKLKTTSSTTVRSFSLLAHHFYFGDRPLKALAYYLLASNTANDLGLTSQSVQYLENVVKIATHEDEGTLSRISIATWFHLLARRKMILGDVSASIIHDLLENSLRALGVSRPSGLSFRGFKRKPSIQRGRGEIVVTSPSEWMEDTREAQLLVFDILHTMASNAYLHSNVCVGMEASLWCEEWTRRNPSQPHLNIPAVSNTMLGYCLLGYRKQASKLYVDLDKIVQEYRLLGASNVQTDQIIARSMVSMAYVDLTLCRWETALELLYDVYESMEDQCCLEKLRCMCLIARVLIMKAQPKKAIEVLRLARRIAGDKGMHHMEKMVSVLVAECHLLRGRSSEALTEVIRTSGVVMEHHLRLEGRGLLPRLFHELFPSSASLRYIVEGEEREESNQSNGKRKSRFSRRANAKGVSPGSLDSVKWKNVCDGLRDVINDTATALLAMSIFADSMWQQGRLQGAIKVAAEVLEELEEDRALGFDFPAVFRVTSTLVRAFLHSCFSTMSEESLQSELGFSPIALHSFASRAVEYLKCTAKMFPVARPRYLLWEGLLQYGAASLTEASSKLDSFYVDDNDYKMPWAPFSCYNVSFPRWFVVCISFMLFRFFVCFI